MFQFLPAENAIQSAGLFSWLLKYFELIIKQRATSRLARIQIKSAILWYTFHRKLSESWRNLNERRTQKPRWSACWTAESNYRLALKSSMQPLRKVSGDPCTTWTIDFWSHEWMGGSCRGAKQSKMGYLFTSRIICVRWMELLHYYYSNHLVGGCPKQWNLMQFLFNRLLLIN